MSLPQSSCFTLSVGNSSGILDVISHRERFCQMTQILGLKTLCLVGCVYHPEVGFIWYGGLAGTGHLQIYTHDREKKIKPGETQPILLPQP